MVIVHGVFWSGLLVAASSYVTDIVPPSRRAEGMSYWGMSTIFAVSMAPAIGLWVYEHGGWRTLCLEAAALSLGMFTIAWTLLPRDPPHAVTRAAWQWSTLVEWKTRSRSRCSCLSFGYGGITSFVAMYSEASGVTPASLYFTVFSIAILVTRPPIARLGDRIGHKRVMVPCLVAVMTGFALLAVGGSRTMFVVSALVFGTGFGSAYPLFLGRVMRHVEPARRGAAFGSIIRGVRHRHRHRIDDDRLARAALRVSQRLRRGGGPGAADGAVPPSRRTEGAAARYPGALVGGRPRSGARGW